MKILKMFGWLGLLGLLGIFTDNVGFFGFFGFFGFWGMAKIKDDELLRKNLHKAGFNAFVVSLASLAAAIAGVAVVKTLEAAVMFIAVTFVVQIITFVISFNVSEKRGES
ncbi:MAG TPA: DUF3796 domain-containing protein [Oscillospiraceae bacterium]|nr:DUF3796 domain-containing protein [Oscillospiraceae bacterium]